MDQDILELVKSLGTGCRHPNDEFFREGNEITKIHKIFGVREVDDEEFYHKLYSVFYCHIPGCSVACKTVLEYDQHYNSCHRFSCSQCNKYLPSSHLLDLHLMETHDTYFLALSDKKPMCYLQECKEVFKTPQERKDHCISEHKFPSNFRFDVTKKSKSAKKKKPKQAATGENCVEMEISGENIGDPVQRPKSSFEKSKKSFVNKRKPILDMKCFVKDMKESLQCD